MKEKLTKLIDVKSVVTLTMTAALIALMFLPVNPAKEIMALFCTSYGAVVTYFFTRQPQNTDMK